MRVQVVQLEVRPELLEAFLVEAKANVQASLQEPGVVQFDLLQDSQNPLRLVLYEVYYHDAALEAHRLTPHYKRWSEIAVPMLAGERVRVLYEKIAP